MVEWAGTSTPSQVVWVAGLPDVQAAGRGNVAYGIDGVVDDGGDAVERVGPGLGGAPACLDVQVVGLGETQSDLPGQDVGQWSLFHEMRSHTSRWDHWFCRMPSNLMHTRALPLRWLALTWAVTDWNLGCRYLTRSPFLNNRLAVIVAVAHARVPFWREAWKMA